MTTQPERRVLDRSAVAYPVHFDGAYTVRAGVTQRPETMTLWGAHLMAAAHNEARINERFAQTLRVEKR